MRYIDPAIVELGRRLRQVREQAGLSQRALAALIGTRQSHISGIESGAHVAQLDTVLRIAHALGHDINFGLIPMSEGMTTNLNHRICERCWFDAEDPATGEPRGVYEDGTYRTPVQVRAPEPGPCCVCGGLTITGIFFRSRPESLLCHGDHDNPGDWSRVTTRPRTDIPRETSEPTLSTTKGDPTP